MHEGNENVSDAADGMLRLAKRTTTVCAVAALMIIINLICVEISMRQTHAGK